MKDLTRPERDWALLIGLGSCVLVGFLLLLIPQCGCVAVDPSASQRDISITPALTAGQIETAIQTAINSNRSTVNDLWPIVVLLVVMMAIAVAGLIYAKKITASQTQDLKDHVDKCNGHS